MSEILVHFDCQSKRNKGAIPHGETWEQMHLKLSQSEVDLVD